MAEFHPTINIEIDKGCCIRKYSGKKNQMEINKLLRELAEDKTNWSGNILTSLQSLIQRHNYEIPYDILEVRMSSVKSTNYNFNFSDENEIESIDPFKIKKEMKKILDNTISDNSNSIDNVYLTLNKVQYHEFDDVHMAHLILLLSDLAKLNEKLWLHINLQIKELGNINMYFANDGHISISSRNNIPENLVSILNNYIKTMNDLIDGKRDIPGVIR